MFTVKSHFEVLRTNWLSLVILAMGIGLAGGTWVNAPSEMIDIVELTVPLDRGVGHGVYLQTITSSAATATLRVPLDEAKVGQCLRSDNTGKWYWGTCLP